MTGELALFDVEAPEAAEWPERPRMLLSYAYAKKRTVDDLAQLANVDVLIDSGAFTAESSGKPVDHDVYLAWLLDHASTARAAFALDVIGDHEASWSNYLHGRDVVGDKLQLIPAWHIGSPWSALERVCEAADYVAIGGAVPYARTPDVLFRLARNAHEVAARYGTQLHGLGITGRRVMYQLPWASVDSSSWNMFGRFSAFSLAERNGRLTAINYGQGPLPRSAHKLARQYGLDTSRMHEAGYGTQGWESTEVNLAIRFDNRVASARSFMYAEVVKRHTTPGFRLYLACDATDDRELRMVNAAHELGNPWVPGTTTTRTTTTTQEEVA